MTKLDPLGIVACRRVREIPLDEFAEITMGRKLYVRWKTQLYAEKIVGSIFKFYYRVKHLLKDLWVWIVWAFQKYVLLDGVRAEARRKKEEERVERLKTTKTAIENELAKWDEEARDDE